MSLEQRNKWFFEIVSREEGRRITCVEDLENYVDQIIHKHECCKFCGLHIPNGNNRLRHRDSERCLKLQAEQKGIVFVPKRDRTRHCDACNKDLRLYNWNKHLHTQCHAENVRKQHEPPFFCTICGKGFHGKRPKRMLKQHMMSKKHRANTKKRGMHSVHAALWRKHFKSTSEES